jgi:undecaprenyl-diphosphatase
MDIFQSIILGIVQGLGEFLPISSTAHLVLAPYFFGWSDPGLSFDVALHIGTLIAVLSFFWRDWMIILKLALQKISNFKFQISNLEEYPSDLLWLLIIASVPGAIFGLIFEKKAETVFRSPLLIAATLSVVGLLLYLIDKYAKHRKDISEVSYKDALVIGFSQAVAIIPGVSRSGATMTAGLALGLSRESAARFSFLLSTPIIFGAAMVKIPSLIKSGINLPIILGIIFAAVSGYLAIKYMLKLISRVGYAPFFWYRLALALAVVIFYFLK